MNRKIQRIADGLGRLITVNEQDATGALAQATNYLYDYFDHLTQVNQGGQLRSYKYDAMGRLLYERIPEQSATINDGTGTYWSCKYTYTEFSAVATKQDARGVVTSYTYDSLHRVGGISYNTSAASGVAATDPVTFGYTSWGALSSVYLTNPVLYSWDYSESYTFDSLNRPTSVTHTIAGQSTTGAYTTSYQYNGAGQLTEMIYPSGNVVDMSYDSRGRLSSESGAISSVSYNTAGQVTGTTLPNLVTQSFGYDPNRMQLTSLVATKNGGPAGGLMNLSYNYQASAGQMGAGTTAGNAGQLMAINNSSTINGTTESAGYTYDNLGRLVTSNQTSNGATAQRRFAYDRWGNRTGVWDATSGGNLIQNTAWEQANGAPTNRLSALATVGWYGTYTYDAAGNVTNDGVHTYQYDAENRLVSVDGGATAQYRYDHQNRRIARILPAGQYVDFKHYIWEGSHVIAEHDGSTPFGPYGSTPYGERSSQVDYIYSGSKLISSLSYTHSCHNDGTAIICTTAGTQMYYLSDRLSTRLVLDSVGNVIGRQGHLPFGEDFGESGTQEKHHFTSYEGDGESGLDYASNREYSYASGRFQQSDPYRASGGADEPQSWNRYSYSLIDPINRKDPSGLDPFLPGENSTGNGRTSACGSFGPSYFVDGFELTREMVCIGVFAALIVREITNDRPTCGDYIAPFESFMLADELAVAEAVFAESSGNDQEGVAIAYVIKNRHWFLNVPGLSSTLGIGPRGASVRQVLGAPGQFPEYDSTGQLRGDAKRRLEQTLAGEPSSPDCQLLYKAHATVYAISLGGIGDPFADQGGSWAFQLGRSSPCPICQYLGKLGKTNFWAIPYTNYTGGARPPWL